jgi:hypothetical protein
MAGVTVFCDQTLAPAFRALDGIGGIGVSPLSAPPALMLAQIQRHTRDDILFTLAASMDQAGSLIQPGSRIDGVFSNSIVLAGRAGGANRASLAGAMVAVTDPTPAATFDGRAVLAANNLAPRSILGAANTGDVAFLVATKAADYGVVYATDVKADARLTVVATLTAPPALTSYAAALNAHAVSPDAGTLLTLLRGGDGADRLRAAGLTVRRI